MKNKRRTKSGRAPKHRRGSLRRYTLYYVIALLLVLSVGAALSLTVFFQIARIDVAGSCVYSQQELIDSSNIRAGDNLLRLDTEKIEQKLLREYPYLESVSVRRSLPDGVTIHVTAAEETAALRGDDGRYALLSRSGRVLETGIGVCPEGMIPADGIDTENLVEGAMLTQPDEEERAKAAIEKNSAAAAAAKEHARTQTERFAVLLELQDELEASGISQKIKVIDVSDLLDLKILYDGRVAVRRGSSLDLGYKIKFAKTTIDSSVTDSTVGTLDVSDKPTARLREYDIYTEEKWMFSPDLRAEYERRIVKDQPWLTWAQDEESEADHDAQEPLSGEEPSSDGEEASADEPQESAEEEIYVEEPEIPVEG